MIELAHPWLLMLVFFPLVIYFFASTYKERRDAVQVPYFSHLVEVSGKEPSKGAVKLLRNKLQAGLLLIGWCSLVIAIARPEWIGDPIEQKKSAREIMVALDLSGSMSEEDFFDAKGNKLNRLDAAKNVLMEFAQQRQHDRLGLILFGDAAYLQAPFTDDIETWIALLNETALGVAGWQTTIGDAIGLSITAFQNKDADNNVLILLTDGYDTGSKMPPIKAAEIAKKFNIKIYTIAMGDPSIESEHKLDIKLLEDIARITGGESFQAINGAELQLVYREINQLEKQEFEVLSFSPRTSLHHIPFGFYILLNFIILAPAIYRRFIRLSQSRRKNTIDILEVSERSYE